MRVDAKSKTQVISYGTAVPVSRTIEEIRHLLQKYDSNESFVHVDRPLAQGGSYIGFVLKTRFGGVPVRVNVPAIHLNGRYLERESYRNALLIIKSKFVEADCGEPLEQAFLPNMPRSWLEKLLPRMSDLPLLEGREP